MRSSWVWAVVLAAALVGCKTKKDPVEPDGEGNRTNENQPPDAGPADITPGDPGTGCPPNCPDEPAATDFPRTDAPNPIPAENAQPGTPDWYGGRQANNGEVELYAGVDTVEGGDKLPIKVNVSVAGDVKAYVYRIGYYGGAGARLIWTGGPFRAEKQPACTRLETTGRVSCNWTTTFEIPTDKSWVSGLYAVKVVRQDGTFKRFTPFVLRDHRKAELLYGVAFNTYQAYNYWGRESLYSDGNGAMKYGRAFEVSYDRPYQDIDGTGKVFYLESALISFIEQHGYDISYTSNLDFTRFKNLLDGVSMFVHGSQDEYWNPEQRTQIDAALAGGKLSLAFFGGNGGYWRVRTLPGQDAKPHRILVCYKGAPEDPIAGSTRRFRDDPSPSPENALFGVMYDGWQLVPFPLVVKNPNHWVFEGTGVHAGDQLTSIVGFEFDKVFDNGFSPPNLEIAFESPTVIAEGLPSRAHAVSRVLPSGTIVFSAGSIWWPLSMWKDPESADVRVQRVTLNVLERGLAHRRPKKDLGPMTGTPPQPNAPIGQWVSSVEAVAGVPGAAGWVDGPGASARFNGPTGLAANAHGDLAVADANNNVVRLILNDPAHTVITMAGNGQNGYRDGAGRQAMFRYPTGVAFGPDGSLYVADSDGHMIRKIANDPPNYTVSIWAGVNRSQGSTDGAWNLAKFRRPTAVATDAEGNVYVADQGGSKIRRIDANTREVTTLAGGQIGYADGAGLAANFNNPSAIGVAPNGDLFVVDSGNMRIRRISGGVTTTIAGYPDKPIGFNDGQGDVARFRAQLGLAVGPNGEVLVADTANFRIRQLTPGADAASTQVVTIAGSGNAGTTLGAGDVADIAAPTGLAFLPDGRIAVSDSYQHVIRVMTR